MPSLLAKKTPQDSDVQQSLTLGSYEAADLGLILGEIEAIVPPLWPLADYVAVNPCVGLTQEKFLSARQILGYVRDCDLLMPRDYFRSQLEEGRVARGDIEAAFLQSAAEYPDWFAGFELNELFDWLAESGRREQPAEPRFRTMSEAVDQRLNSTWSSHIINDITRHCALHFDQGQAAWANPWSDRSLYEAWLEAASLGRRMDLLGLRGFRIFVLQLPRTPKETISKLLSQLDIPKPYWRHFLLCELFSIAGWASFVKYRVREAKFAANCDEDLLGLLAIRLAYDVALAQSPGIPWPLALWPADVQIADGTALPPTPPTDAVARYTLQVATERAYRRQLCGKLAKDSKPRQSTLRKTLQMVCCIDVRSEVLRRHLESVDESIETFGFAGFFGMALEYVSFGASSGPSQCPVLLTPNFRVHESLLGASEQEQSQASQRRQTVRTARKLWKSFQTSAASCFSFVETLGLSFVAKLLTDSLRLTRPVPTAERDGLSSHANRHLGPDIHSPHNSGLPPQRQIDLAEGMLRNLGLTDGFGRIVLLCGHAADVTNNPYKAGLDCGACGGHSGEPNARVAAALLNDPEVRRGLLNRGIIIPHDTWFAASVHNTTTDAVRLCDPQLAPLSHAADFQRVESWLSEASQRTRIERCRRLGTTEEDDLLRRSADWSEVRPEWGLAGNAAFIVAPRSRTKGLDLGGRTFMHSYEYSRDPEMKVLELIMTAPMVVTNWINMQYYASVVDPRAFGSGNKVIHNVVGQFGVLQGNGGDLMTGLPLQSVHDGRQLQHEPLRLLVVIDAPRDAVARIIAKHALVRNLVTNGWLHLMAWDQDQFYRWTSQETWEEEQFS